MVLLGGPGKKLWKGPGRPVLELQVVSVVLWGFH